MKITSDLLPAMQGVIPSIIGTTSAQGVPNVTYISQVFYLDAEHVALSWQFMNKSWKNILENPHITVILTDPATFTLWELKLKFNEIQHEGPVFDLMDMQLAAIASTFPNAAHFKIKAALVCKVEDVRLLHDGK